MTRNTERRAGLNVEGRTEDDGTTVMHAADKAATRLASVELGGDGPQSPPVWDALQGV